LGKAGAGEVDHDFALESGAIERIEGRLPSQKAERVWRLGNSAAGRLWTSRNTNKNKNLDHLFCVAD